jgi:threonylcarbamoyladenosine tRNA methylthiotransferase MtaB
MYRVRDYAELIQQIITEIPDIGIGTDIIVGFPGESTPHFERTYAFVQNMPFSYLHVFPYSRRPGTVAAGHPDQVGAGEKKERTAALRRLRAAKIHTFQRRFVGQHLFVLLEYRRDKTTHKLTGLSDNYVRVLVDGEDSFQGRCAVVRVEKTEGEQVHGSVELLI